VPSFAAGMEHERYFRPHTPDLFSFNGLDYDFDPQAPPPLTFLGFLDQLWHRDPESIDTLQEIFGYLLLRDTRKDKIPGIIGPTRSGKGTIIHVLSRVIGHNNVVPTSLSALAGDFGLWPLIGKTLAVIGDCRVDGRMSVAKAVENILSISGGDEVLINRKMLPSLNKKLPTRLMIVSNELPKLPDPSGALAGRMLLLRTTESWLGREDETLKERCAAEAAGVLLWAIEGWKRLRRRGHFVQTVAGQELQERLQDLGSPIKAFVADCCAVGQGYKTDKIKLYRVWEGWCDTRGHKPGTDNVFSRNLYAAAPAVSSARPIDEQTGERTHVYTGICLKEEKADQDARIGF